MKFYLSKSFHGLIVTLIASIAMFFLSKTPADKYFAISSATGALISFIGRITESTPIDKPKLHFLNKGVKKNVSNGK